MSILQIRLKNCIQTILELEPEMRRQGENSFDEEFFCLKEYLKEVDAMDLAESDVLKMENVTSLFLAELQRGRFQFHPCARMLQ